MAHIRAHYIILGALFFALGYYGSLLVLHLYIRLRRWRRRRVRIKPAFTVQATYKSVGKLKPRRFPPDE